MDIFRALSSLVFVVSFADLARFVVAQCRCGMTNLSGDLFSEIVDDVGCNATSNQVCCVNGTAVDPETYRAVKAYNCTSECFEAFGIAPSPTTTVARATSPQVSGLPQSALIAIVVGVIVVFLFVVCLLCICLRKRKQLKKKSNRTVTAKTDARIREDLQTIITSSPPSVSTSQEDDLNTSSFWPSGMTKIHDVPGPTSPLNDGDTSFRPSVEYEEELENISLPTPSTQQPTPPTQQTPVSTQRSVLHQPPVAIPNRDQIASHPVEFAASPEWDKIELQMDEGSPPVTTTSLNRYLESQGFSTSDHIH